MSLRDAVLEIADQMQTDSDEWAVSTEPSLIYAFVRGYIRQLRSAVKASEGESHTQAASDMQWIPGQNNHLSKALAQQAKEELQSATSRLHAEEAVGVQGVVMAVLHGGPFDGDTVPLSPDMPKGAKTAIGDAVYQLTESGELQYLEQLVVK